MNQKTFKKIMVANRGEIALRVLHAIKELGYRSVVVHSAADSHSLAAQAADESYCLAGVEVSETYLNMDQILSIAKQTGVDAIHPGYGFLSENPRFAERCAEAGIKFIGPRPETMAILGDKMAAKKIAEQAKVPVIPGVPDIPGDGKKLKSMAEKVGFPLLIKAAAGGGGKGMRVVHDTKDFADSVAGARREAKAYFGDDRVFVEKYIEEPRHIEVQVLGDEHGNIVHLFERECSIQRRHQKMIEESPSPSIDDKVRKAICEAAVRLAKAAKYFSAGTVEFIVDAKNKFYFLEVNTRLQVEHPVTEFVTGIDLVKAQIKIAEGHCLPIGQKDIVIRGHAIECRLYAEDPENDFLPSEGKVGVLREPSRPGVRLDSSLVEGQTLLSLYDPLLAKLSVYGISRKEALLKMDALLRDYVLLGLRHNLDFLRYTVNSEAFQSGHYHTHTVQELLPIFVSEKQEIPAAAWLVATLASQKSAKKYEEKKGVGPDPLAQLTDFRNA